MPVSNVEKEFDVEVDALVCSYVCGVILHILVSHKPDTVPQWHKIEIDRANMESQHFHNLSKH